MKILLVAAVGLLLVVPASSEERREPSISDAPVLSPAEKRADELDRMFAKLRKPPSAAAVRIWELWAQSDSVTADILLQQSARAIKDTQFVEARAMLDQLVSSRPSYAEAYNMRATLLFLQDDYTGSLADLARVLDLEPRHFGALSGRGMIYFEQGKDREAMQAFREALAINPELEGVKAAVKDLEKRSPDI